VFDRVCPPLHPQADPPGGHRVHLLPRGQRGLPRHRGWVPAGRGGGGEGGGGGGARGEAAGARGGGACCGVGARLPAPRASVRLPSSFQPPIPPHPPRGHRREARRPGRGHRHGDGLPAVPVRAGPGGGREGAAAFNDSAQQAEGCPLAHPHPAPPLPSLPELKRPRRPANPRPPNPPAAASSSGPTSSARPASSRRSRRLRPSLRPPARAASSRPATTFGRRRAPGASCRRAW
jgi:hypothetical protein